MLSETVKQIFTEHGGVLRLEQVPDLGLSKEAIRKMYLRGDLEKVHAGVYVLADELPDDFVLMQSIYPRGILSHESAARLYGFTPMRQPTISSHFHIIINFIKTLSFRLLLILLILSNIRQALRK